MPEFVRVRDTSTRHQFDVPPNHPQIGKGLELLNSDRFPDLTEHDSRPRAPLYFVEKGEPTPAAKVSTKKEA